MELTILEKFWLPLAVLSTSFFAPLLMAVITNRSRRAEKEQDYARQDTVARQAAEAARLLSEQQKISIIKTEEVAKQAAEAAKILSEQQAKTSARAEEVAELLSRNTTTTNNKLEVIHTLVNSNLTSSMQSEHDATRRELAMMLEVIELKKVAGLVPSIETLAEVEATKIKIAELSARLADRTAQQAKVEVQLKEQAVLKEKTGG